MAIVKLKPRKTWIKYIEGLEDIQNKAIYIGMKMMGECIIRGLEAIKTEKIHDFSIEDVEFVINYYKKEFKCLEENYDKDN